jgi:hypothetical protein
LLISPKTRQDNLHPTKFSSSLVASVWTSPPMTPFEGLTKILYIVATIPVHTAKRAKMNKGRVNSKHTINISLKKLNTWKGKTEIHLNGEICWPFRPANINTWKISGVAQIYLPDISKIIQNSHLFSTIPIPFLQSKTAKYKYL